MTADGRRHSTGALCASCVRAMWPEGLGNWGFWPISSVLARQPEIGTVEIVYEGAEAVLSEDQRAELLAYLEHSRDFYAEEAHREETYGHRDGLPPAPELSRRIRIKV